MWNTGAKDWSCHYPRTLLHMALAVYALVVVTTPGNLRKGVVCSQEKDVFLRLSSKYFGSGTFRSVESHKGEELRWLSVQ